ncbi:MAG: WHG domain-containing protein [Anaerolineales bacterium]|nr:WHG domain-containing protein [Anaerolineales bacterium]MCA9974355.1 WHG domain-containing protein [Anaerolineales bacterium]
MPKRRWLKRDVVIEQAAALANEAGSVTAVSLATLAQALQIRPPSLYNHVASLEDLHRGLALLGLRQLIVELRQASLGLVGREAILATASAYRRFVHAQPGIYPLTVRAPEPEETEATALSQELVQMLLLMMASLGLQGDDAIHAIRGLRAILHGFTSLETAAAYKIPLDQDESFYRLLNAYLDGLTQ